MRTVRWLDAAELILSDERGWVRVESVAQQIVSRGLVDSQTAVPTIMLVSSLLLDVRKREEAAVAPRFHLRPVGEVRLPANEPEQESA